MSSWKVENFLGKLDYEEGEDQSDPEELCKEEVMLDDSDEIKHEQRATTPPEAMTYSPGSALECRVTPAGSFRDRSRSPLLKEESACDLQSSSSSNISDDDDDEDQTWAPNADDVYSSVNENSDITKMKAKTKTGRGDVKTEERDRLIGRVLEVSGPKRTRRPRQGDFNQPVEEIMMSDDDIPLHLRERDVVRKREMKAQEKKDRAMRAARDKTDRDDESESTDEDGFKNATYERKNALLESDSRIFEWYPMKTFQPREEHFTPEHTGSIQCHWSPYDAFRSFWDDSILEHIVDCTNRYASNIKISSYQKEWYPTNSHEVLCLFAFWMMLGILRMPTSRSCFSTDPLLRTEVFRKMFTARRYRILARSLNFANTADSTNSDVRSDLLYPIRSIINSLNANFQANYVPSKDICIGESLSQCKGTFNVTKQYIPSKGAKHGIKSVELCESATGYLWSFTVYTGKQNDATIVKKLVKPLLNKGYRLFIGNWTKSLDLARFLKRNGTDCVGTLPPSDPDVPIFIHQTPLRRGQLIARHSNDICVLSWQDKKRVTMISTCHGTASGMPRVLSKPGFLLYKPQVVLDYDRSMGGVDLNDQLLEPYLVERKLYTKWYKKLFKRFLNVSVSNARILMGSSLQCPQEEHLNFRLRLVDIILDNHLSQCPKARRQEAKITMLPDPIRKVPHIHWPVRVEAKEGYSSKNRKTRVRCFVCIREGRKTHKTPYKCEACNVPLCVEDCFKKYHLDEILI